MDATLIKVNLNKVANAVELAEVSGIVEKAALYIDLDLGDLEEDEFANKVYIGTPGGLRKFSIAGTDVSELIDWTTDKGKIGTYAIFVSASDEIFEIIKQESISGVRVELDNDMREAVDNLNREIK